MCEHLPQTVILALESHANQRAAFIHSRVQDLFPRVTSQIHTHMPQNTLLCGTDDKEASTIHVSIYMWMKLY